MLSVEKSWSMSGWENAASRESTDVSSRFTSYDCKIRPEHIRQVDTSMCSMYIDGRHGSGHSVPGPAASPV